MKEDSPQPKRPALAKPSTPIRTQLLLQCLNAHPFQRSDLFHHIPLRSGKEDDGERRGVLQSVVQWSR